MPSPDLTREVENELTKDAYYGYLLGGLTKYYRMHITILNLHVNFMRGYRKLKSSKDMTGEMVQYSVRYLHQEVK